MPTGAATGRVAVIERALERAGIAQRPVAVLDLDAFDANAADLTSRAHGMPIRVASKSLRVRALIERALGQPGFAGVLAYTLPEALWLASHGIDDIVVAYPTADAQAIAALAADDHARSAITLMVDETAHLDLILTAARGAAGPARSIRVAIELDVSYAPLPGVRFGAHRSPLRTTGQVLELVRQIQARPGLRLVGMMAYEGQIAGVGDAARTPYGSAVRAMKSLSTAEIAQRRSACVAAVREVTQLEFVNGGGTGSIESTGNEDAVTEIAAGSGLIGPGLFDHYRAFRPEPALLLGAQVVRRPAQGIATLMGGGWIASGVGGPDRLPTIHHPRGLAFAPQEGAGEVQTPVIGPAAEQLRVGGTVWLRHAKAGEPAEHALHYQLVAGETVVGSTPTYRGEGKLFL